MEEKIFNIPRRFVRGQVWMVREDREISEIKVEMKDRTVSYTRPCIIMTDQYFIDKGEVTLTVVPITSKALKKHRHEDDLFFYERNGKLHKILTNQITTKDVSNFISYMYTMPPDIMEELESRLQRRQGLGQTVRNLEEKIKELENEIDHLKDVAYEYVQQALSKTVSEETYEVKHYTYVDVSNNSESDDKPVESENHMEEGGEKKKLIRWSIDDCLEFIKFASVNDTNTIREKFNLKDNAAVYSKRQHCKKMLLKNNIDIEEEIKVYKESLEKIDESRPLTKAEKAAKKAAKKAKMNAAKPSKEYKIPTLE